MTSLSTTVLVVGAGPVGLLICLALGKANVPTMLLEKHNSLPKTTRAMVYQPIVLSALEDLGILEKIKQLAFWNDTGIVWRDENGKSLAHLPTQGSEAVLLLGQARMARFLLQELENYPSVQVRFNVEVVGIDQSSATGTTPPQRQVRVMVHETKPTHDDDIIINADYVFGTDGANSSVRRALCIPFEGYTWQDVIMIGTDVLYDFPKKNEWYTPMQFIVHPDNWAVIVYSGEDANGEPYGSARPLFRVAYGESSNLDFDPEKIKERAQERIKRYTQGDADYEVTRAEPYRLHQRCAAKSHVGRVFLAGDALHSNNPMGGLGLTGGILDAYTYGNALVRVIEGGEDSSLIEECAESRRSAWINATNPTSAQNLKRMLSEKPEDVKEREGFFDKLANDKDFPIKFRAKMGEMIPQTFKRA